MSGDELTELEQAIQADLDELAPDLSGQTEATRDKKKPKGKKAKKQEAEAPQGSALDRWYARYQPVIGNAFQPEGFTDLIKTSMPKFNAIMGVGGLPRGCITTVWGK